MKFLKWIKPRPKLMRMVVAGSYFAGIAAVVGWSLPEDGNAGLRDELTVRLPDAPITGATGARSTSVSGTGISRNKLNCEECGVIESVRRIDRRGDDLESCALGDTAGTRIPGSPIGDGGHRDLATLADMVAGAIVGDHGTANVGATTRHQIVIRFRDGSRHVFNEEKPRTWRVGDRIHVIAGATGANG